MMGMSAAAGWMSWFLQFFIYLLLASAIYTLFLSIGVGGKKSVLVYSDPSLVFVFLLLYSVCIITYCFFVSTLVNKGRCLCCCMGRMGAVGTLWGCLHWGEGWWAMEVVMKNTRGRGGDKDRETESRRQRETLTL